MARPLYKWSGGKGRLYDKYKELSFFPREDEFDTFVDLFFGGGAVTCWVAEKYPTKPLIINDLNGEMIKLMNQMRDNWEEFKGCFERTASVFLSTTQDKRKELFKCYRNRYFHRGAHLSDAQEAADLLILLKTNFNGIWSSKDGRLKANPGHLGWGNSVFSMHKIERFREVLLRATIYNRSFEEVPIPERSWIFADPPYRATSEMYGNVFPDELQVKLAEHLKAQKNCLWATSNLEQGDGFWYDLFAPEQIHFKENQFICGGGKGNTVIEVLIKNYGLDIAKAPDIDSFFG